MRDFKKATFKRFLTLTIGFLFSVSTHAQHENLLDSLAKNNSFDQSRIFYGYMESKSRILSTDALNKQFLQQVEAFAKAKNEIDLLKEIDFIKNLKRNVFDFSKEKWIMKLELLIDKYKKEKSDLFLAYCYHEKGQIEFQLEMYQKAFESDLKCIEIIEKIGYAKVPKIGKITHEIALHYYFFKEYKEVIRLMRISIKFPPFSRGLDMQRYNNLGISYYKLQKNDSSRYFFDRGLKTANNYKADVWMGLISANLGDLYYDQNQLDSSYYYYRKNYQYNANEPLHSTIKLNAVIDMAKIYLATDSLSKGTKFLSTAEQYLLANPVERHLGDKQLIEKSKLAFYKTKIKYLKKTGDYKTALSLKDSVFNLEGRLYAKYHSAIIQLSEKENAIVSKNNSLIETQEEKSQMNLLYSGIIAFILASGSIGFYYMHRAKMKKKAQRDALLIENKAVTLEKQQTKKELEVAKKEMQYFVTKISEQNKKLVKLETKLENSQVLEAEKRASIQSSIHQLKDIRILTDENWLDFQDNFDTMFPDFRLILKAETPSITTSEMRYLMLTKLQFSHKEMALALGVSTSTMRVTWNRVRKRLNGTLEDTPHSLLEKAFKTKEYLN